MKVALAILIVVGIALAVDSNRQSAVIKQQQKDLSEAKAMLTEANTKLSQRAASESLELQQKCAAQARAQYAESGWEKEKLGGYISHYNQKMNACYMVISNTDTKTAAPNISTTYTLVDAFEGKVFGNYMWQTQQGKQYWEVAPFVCDVTLPSGEKKVCKSDAEFKELISVYMGDMRSQ